MIRLLFQYLAIENTKILPNSITHFKEVDDDEMIKELSYQRKTILVNNDVAIGCPSGPIKSLHYCSKKNSEKINLWQNQCFDYLVCKE